ncbi:unnamed protein product [Alternaria alternata]
MNPLFCYTNGRWLWNEREQLEARYRRFDVSSLKQAACQAVGAHECVSFNKIGEGNYNKAYRLEMDDGQKIIAKVPHPNAGPPKLTTASEVATMEFARTILNIPVPRVLAWSATDQNPVQAEYIIMEEASGSQLHEVWQDLPLRKKSDIIRTSSAEYLKSIARREIEWINPYADPQEPSKTPWQYTSPQQTSPEAHTVLLKRFLATVSYITPKDPELASPRLWHPDFHAGNVYVDDQARISCIIDWQGAWAGPMFISANPPLLLDYGIDMLMKLPENFKTLDDATKDKLRYQVSQSILIHTYEETTAEKNPLMYKVMRHPHGQTLKQLEAFAGSTWDNCLFPFEECLIRTERCVDLFTIMFPG